METLTEFTLRKEYKKKSHAIKSRLKEFSAIRQEEYFYELIFCLLTPQSNAKKCWDAVQELKKCSRNIQDKEYHQAILITPSIKIKSCLKRNTRFYKNKTAYILELAKNWKNTEKIIYMEKNPIYLREFLAKNIKGLGMKEASHFIRNIGKSKNQLAILDRHILKNLIALKVIQNIPDLNKNNYLLIEKLMKNFSKKIKIPLDELDLLLWSLETGEIFK
ncbi:MAG: DNA lyase [archaeon]